MGLNSEALAALVASNEVKIEAGEINAKVGDKDHTRPYQKVTAVTYDGALALCDGRLSPTVDEKGETKRGEASVLGHFNYGFDLNVRARERQVLMAAVEGPDKTIAKAAKALSALLGITEEDAAATIRAQMAARAAKDSAPVEEGTVAEA